jgi:hypothetical protein
MELTFPRKAIFVAAIIICTLLWGNALAAAAQLDDVKAAIRQQGARWTAGETSVSSLPLERKYLLASALPPRLTGNERVVKAAVSRSGAPLAAAPASLDWRNHNGNFVTHVRDQGSCGSCWAFATTAALESYTLIKNQTPGQDLNLAEQVLLSCSGAGDCESGGYTDDASTYIKNTGLPLESCDPYTDADGLCSNACPDWQKSAYKIGSWAYVTQAKAPTNVTNIKNALNTYGPLVTFMWVYDDFFYYTSGVYAQSSGTNQGGHAILIVGYDDANQCFIVKNSWGAGWGESGYFRIAYSQCTNGVAFGTYTIAYEPPASPAIATSTAALVSSCPQGQNAASQTFQVWNSGGGTLSYTVAAGQSWLSPNPPTGASTGEHDTITVNYATAGLAPGTYQGVLTISAAGITSQQLAVSLQVLSADPPVLSLSSTLLVNSCTQGQNAASTVFELWNSGGSTLNYSISSSAAWASVTPSQGTSTGEHDIITLNFATASLAAGNYQTLLTVSAPGVDPQQITVNLQVIAPPPDIALSPDFLNNVCKPGKNAVSQTFTIRNSGGGALDYTLTADQPWLSFTPASGAITTELNTVKVTYATSALAEGIYTANITITAAGAVNTPQTIRVRLRVSKSAGHLPWLEMLLANLKAPLPKLLANPWPIVVIFP